MGKTCELETVNKKQELWIQYLDMSEFLYSQGGRNQAVLGYQQHQANINLEKKNIFTHYYCCTLTLYRKGAYFPCHVVIEILFTVD